MFTDVLYRDLARRGLARTAFEFARLLWALDPWTDPHGALLHLEFLASKGMNEWMEEVSQVFESHPKQSEGKMDPTVLPGWTWSRAVVMRLTIDDPGKVCPCTIMVDDSMFNAVLEPSTTRRAAEKEYKSTRGSD